MKTIFSFVLFISHAASGLSASISGVVKDPHGAVVPDARVTLFSRTSGDFRATVSDAAGAYAIGDLPEGNYLLRVESGGFANYLDENLHLDPGAARTVDVKLEVAGVREEVVVTASSTPQAPDEVSKAITVIDQSEADERDAAALSDVVDLVPSVRVQQLGGPGAFTTIQIRGLRTQDTAVLVDGLRIRDAASTQADASGLIEDLLFTDADRAEVLRGSGSSLYGTNAIGGVINIITDEGGGPVHGSLLLEGGSLGMGRGRAQLAGGFHHDRIEYSLGFTELDVTSGVGGDNPYRDASLQSRVTFRLSPSLRLIARLYAGDSFGMVAGEPDIIGNPSGFGIVQAIPLAPSQARLYYEGVPLSSLNVGNATFIPAPPDPDSTRAARFMDGALILNGQPSASLDYSLSYQVLSNSRRYGNGPAGVDYQPEGSTRSLYDGRIQTVNAHADYRLAAHNLITGGYEFESETYANDNSEAWNPAAFFATNVTQSSNSFFLQDQARLLDDRLQLSGAFRAQYFMLDTPTFIPAASAPYQGISFAAPTPAYTGDGSAAYFFRKSGTKLRGHVGRGYRAPSLYERFGAGFDPVFGYSVYGDPRLTPEHSIGVDAGIDQTFLHDRVRASATYFYTSLENVIVFDTSGLINPATDPWGRYIGYINSQGGISRGVELSASLAPTRHLNVRAAYTYANAIERTPIVGDVIQTFVVPKNQFSILATERVGSRLIVTFDTLQSSNYLAPVYGDIVTQTYRFNGLHKINAGVSYRISLSERRALRLFARGENLFNQTYFESGFLTPGRTGTGGLQFEF